MTNGYTNIFGGLTSFPSQVSERNVTLTVSTVLVWPTEDTTSQNPVARIMDVVASSTGLTMTMPPANQTGVGNTTLFYNAGVNSFSVLDNGGTVQAVVASGQAWQMYIRDNSTAAGLWRVFQFGTGTSSASAAALAGFGLVAILTTLNQAYPVSYKSANYSFVAADRAGMFINNGGAVAFNMPNSAAATNSWFVQVRNGGTGILMLQCTGTDTINGGSAGGSINLNPTDSCAVINDGAGNFWTVGIGQAVQFAWSFVSIDVSGTGTLTLTGNQLNQSIYRFTGILTGNRIVQVPPTVQQYTIVNATTGAFSFTFQTSGGTGVTLVQNAATIVFCDGTNINYSDTAGIGVPVTIANGGTGATTAAQALINLGGGTTGISEFQATTPAAARAVIGAMGQDDVVALSLIFGR